MTVIVGALCKKGIVIGADSSATSSVPIGRQGNINTVEQRK